MRKLNDDTMDPLYNDLMQQLAPYEDRVYYYGLTETEIAVIERETGQKFPAYFRAFLKTFGVRQDIVFGLFTSERDFAAQKQYLPKNLKKAYILIGDNGGKDYWLLNANDETDTNLYEWQHWVGERVVPLGFNFGDLLKKSIAALSDPKVPREPVAAKNWCVQFSIPTGNEERIYSTIPLIRIEAWELKEISPAEVYCYEAKAMLAEKPITLKRNDYAGWSSPSYYFDLQEPVSHFGLPSLIKELDGKLRKAFPQYKLIDYGIL
ncbi:MAG TPA: SMI1/KNR4 family protein [Puia sp.]|nr:SMI1/KNR4 family protein [Puia sp.]